MSELIYASPLGAIRIVEAHGAIVSAAFIDAAPATVPTCPVLQEAKDWLDRYFRRRDPKTPPRLAPNGTAFQKAVWEALLSVPYGETVTYGELAASMGLTPHHARAIGSALHRNPIVLFLPCHRVLGQDGALTGYAYGIERKAALLSLERRM